MRIPLKLAGGLIIGLGLLISVAAAASAISDARQPASPFDQPDDTGGSSQEFVPILAPQAQPAGQMAPTLPARATGLTVASPSAQPSSTTHPSAALSGPTQAPDGPTPTATPPPILVPDRIVIPALKLDARVVAAKLKEVEYLGKQYQQWVAPPSFAAGWLTTSAPLGLPGNTVLSGHNNLHGEVFGHLEDLQPGDLILMYSGDTELAYAVALILILPERFQPVDVRLANARWIEPSQDERLTLVTCWPYTSNSHRLIVVATRVSLDDVQLTEVTPRLTAHPPLPWNVSPTVAPLPALPEPTATASP